MAGLISKQSVAYRRITTTAPLGVVVQSADEALRRLGGTRSVTQDAVTLTDAKVGVNMAFVANVNARAVVKKRESDEYEIECMIDISPNALWWICLVVGAFCLWPLWIVNGLYFMADPMPAYQAALDRIEIRPPTRTA